MPKGPKGQMRSADVIGAAVTRMSRGATNLKCASSPFENGSGGPYVALAHIVFVDYHT